MEALRFPIGRSSIPEVITAVDIRNWIEDIELFPRRVRAEVEDLTESDLDKSYRPDGWSIRQLIHHCADSHMNSFIRFKLALTEVRPTIKPYEENLWANLPDGNMDIVSSLKIIDGVHQRWTILLNHLSEVDMNRTFIHPANDEMISIKQNIGLYSWHCRHHLAHIRLAKNRAC